MEDHVGGFCMILIIVLLCLFFNRCYGFDDDAVRQQEVGYDEEGALDKDKDCRREEDDSVPRWPCHTPF